jgi:hypothetical protein
MSQIRAEFGSAVKNLAAYYRNGGIVPSQISEGGGSIYYWEIQNTTTRSPDANTYHTCTSGTTDIYWGFIVSEEEVSIKVATLYGAGGLCFTPISEPDPDDNEGTVGATQTTYAVAGNNDIIQYQWEYIEESVPVSNVDVNQNVPTSGPISVKDFYGARGS